MNKHLVIVVGPTGVGKTAFSVSLAQHFNTSILSADSRQLYKELNIGTAKPTLEEMKGVKHFFIDSVSITDNYTTAHFENDALVCLDKLYEKSNIAILCGGTGLYVGALCNGLDELPERDEKIREELNLLYEIKGIEALQEKLKQLDDVQFSKMDSNNPQRLIRALEVCITTGNSYSEAMKGIKKQRNFTPIIIGLNIGRELLYHKINKRVDEMIEKGLVEEASTLFPQKSLNALQTIGYVELFDYFENKIDLPTAIEKIKQHSRNYAKRQLTWFRRYTEIKWVDPTDLQSAIDYVSNNMKP